MRFVVAVVLLLCAVGSSACGFAERSGLNINVHLTRQSQAYPVLPGAVSTVNNAFVHATGNRVPSDTASTATTA